MEGEIEMEGEIVRAEGREREGERGRERSKNINSK